MRDELIERYAIEQRFILGGRVLVVHDTEPWATEEYNRDIVAVNDEAYTDVRGLAESVVSFLNERLLHWQCPSCGNFGTCQADDVPADSEHARGDLLSYGLAVPEDLTSTERVMGDSGRTVTVYDAFCGCDEDR